eukprot:COSAG02_NODE_2369_length_9049_cov_37.484358_2_plen_126_part_00
MRSPSCRSRGPPTAAAGRRTSTVQLRLSPCRGQQSCLPQLLLVALRARNFAFAHAMAARAYHRQLVFRHDTDVSHGRAPTRGARVSRGRRGIGRTHGRTRRSRRARAMSTRLGRRPPERSRFCVP